MSNFFATHRHADGGLYEVLREVKIHVWNQEAQSYSWEDGVLYKDGRGREYVRTKDDFHTRFTAL